ncbi:MAG: hypothetical protein QOF60_1518 [Actinomycetota bacterium]|jgi:hypothetical protein|nr:hypothetical protein [Actinomycetota bacterium]
MTGFLWRTALRRGLLGGSRPWMTVFAVIGLTRVFKKLSGSEPKTVYREELQPGETILITHER